MPFLPPSCPLKGTATRLNVFPLPISVGHDSRVADDQQTSLTQGEEVINVLMLVLLLLEDVDESHDSINQCHKLPLLLTFCMES